MSSVDVFFAKFLVGRIAVADDGAPDFTYDPAWRATRGAFPISLSIPIEDRAYPSEIISPWLANLLPEEEQLNAMAHTLGLSQTDVLAILSEIGGDTAGALSFAIPNDRAAWKYTPLTELYKSDDPQEALEQHFDDLGRRPFLAGEEGVRLSLAGGQKKSALAVLGSDGAAVLRLPLPDDVLAVPRNGAPSTIIVKPDNPRLPGITENEVFCLRLANAIGIRAAETSVLSTGKRPAICVLRYDRRSRENGEIQRIHQEDFAQANSLPPGRKYEHGHLPGLSLQRLLSTGARLGPRDALSLLDQVIFNILVANTDAHAKNYSLLLPVAGAPHLAPLYDVSTVLTWPHVVQKFAQNLAGKRRKPGDIAPRHWDAIAEEMGYRAADLRSRVVELVDLMVANRVEIAQAVASIEGVTTGYIHQAAEAIEQNALRIAGRLHRAPANA